MNIALLLAALLAPCFQAGRPTAPADLPRMPEFGRSVTFSDEAPRFRVEDLRGKLALLLFFQSW
jgi:hypothetical protein